MQRLQQHFIKPIFLNATLRLSLPVQRVVPWLTGCDLKVSHSMLCLTLYFGHFLKEKLINKSVTRTRATILDNCLVKSVTPIIMLAAEPHQVIHCYSDHNFGIYSHSKKQNLSSFCTLP